VTPDQEIIEDSEKASLRTYAFLVQCARAAALEEAAKVAEDSPTLGLEPWEITDGVAAAIRALKDTTNE
jgi:hypothetical protein